MSIGLVSCRQSSIQVQIEHGEVLTSMVRGNIVDTLQCLSDHLRAAFKLARRQKSIQ